MTMRKLCYALVTTWLVTMTGCGDVQNASEIQDQSENQNQNEGQTSQAISGCELDCPGGPVFTCSPPCSVTATSLTCNGIVTNCPIPDQSTCGNGIVEGNEACDDGNHRSFDRCSPDCLHACPSGKIWCDCTGELCLTPTQCNQQCSQ